MDNTVQMLSDIRERVVRVETKIDSMNDVKDTAEQAKIDARDAIKSAKSCQHQINELKEGQKWLWRTVGAAFITGIVGGLVAIIWKGLGG